MLPTPLPDGGEHLPFQLVLSPPHLSHSSPLPSQKHLFPDWEQGAVLVTEVVSPQLV